MGKLNMILNRFANINHTGFLLVEKWGHSVEVGLEAYINGEVRGVMDLHGADFVLGPQTSMLDCMPRGVELTGVTVLIQRSGSGIVSLKENGITSSRRLEGKCPAHWVPRWLRGVISKVVCLDGDDYGKVELVPTDVGDIVPTLGAAADVTWAYTNRENEEPIAAGKEVNSINLVGVDPLSDFCALAIAATHQVLRDHSAEVRAFLVVLNRDYQEAARDPGGVVPVVKDGLSVVPETMLVRSQRHLAPLLLDQRGHWGAIRPERWERMANWLAVNGYYDRRRPTEYANDFLPVRGGPHHPGACHLSLPGAE